MQSKLGGYKKLAGFFLATALLVPLVAYAATFVMPNGSNYFAGHLFSTYTGATGTQVTTGQVSPLHTFTVTKVGGTGTLRGLKQSFAPGNLPTGSGYPATSPQMHEMSSDPAIGGFVGGGIVRYTFNQALPVGTHVYMQDVDQGESATLTFQTCAGVAINPSGFDYLRVSTLYTPNAAFNAINVVLTDTTGNVNRDEALVAIIIRDPNVCRIDYAGTFAGGTWETYFSLPPTDLSVTKSLATPNPVVPGGPASWTITITNTSPATGIAGLANPARAYGVSMTDNVNSNLTGLTAAITASGGTTGGSCAVGAGNAVSCSGFSSLATGSSIVITLSGTLAGSYASTTLANTATVSHTTPNDTNPGNNSATSTTPVSISPNFGTCDARMFFDSTNGTFNSSQLYNINTATSPMTFSALGPASSIARNGLGYHPTTNYLYTIQWGTNNLIRLDSNGVGTTLGAVSGLPTGAFSYSNGVIAPNGDFYVKQNTGQLQYLYRINIATLTATQITLNSGITTADLAWYGGNLYAINNGSLVRIAITGATGAVTTIGPTGISGLITPHSMWGFTNGIFAYHNSAIYAIDPLTGAGTRVSDSTAAVNGDGANCASASVAFDADLSVTKTNTPASGPNDLPTDNYLPGETRTYSIVVTNNGPFGAQNVMVSDPIPAGIVASTVSWTCTATSGGAACGAASGTGALNDTGLDLPAGAVATYRVTLTVPATFTGDLSNTVTITPPSTITDTNPANNTATDVDQSGQPNFGTCDARMFLSQSPNISTNTTLYNINTSANPLTFPAIGQGSLVYNSTAYNPQDNYIYAINAPGYSGNRLIRIGMDGSTVDLGVVTGLPVSEFNAGDIAPDGTYYVYAGSPGSGTLYAINIATMTATARSLSPGTQASDLAWIGGLLYTVDTSGQLKSINPGTGTVTNIGTPSGAITLGALFGAPNGLFGSANGGGFYQINLLTGARTLISGSPTSSFIDGAHCATADITFPSDLAITKTDGNTTYTPGTSVVYTIVVSNNGPFGAQNARVQDLLPAGISTANWTCAAANGAVCRTASGTGAIDARVDLPFNTAGAGATATFTLTMAVPANFTGDLVNTATVEVAAGNTDPVPGNNSATDTNTSAQPNFGTCDARMFLATTANNALNTQLNLVDRASNPISYLPIGSPAVPAYDAIGFNPLDSYLYGIDYSGFAGNELFRIGSNGSVVNLGPMTLSTGGSFPSVNVAGGAFSPTGEYYISSRITNTLYRVNLVTRVATPVLTSAELGIIIDFAFVGNYIYAPFNITQLVRIDPVAGSLTVVGAAGSSGGGAPSVWSSANDGLFSLGGGALYQWNIATGSRILLGGGPITNDADGASCPTAPNSFNADLSVTKTNTPAQGPNDLLDDTYTPGETRTYSIVVSNSGPFGAHGVMVSDPLPAGITSASWTCSGTAGGICTASGSDAINDTAVGLPVGASVTYLLALTVPQDYTGDLSNTVTVTPGSATTDTNLSNNQATDVDQVVLTANLSITKTSNTSPVTSGGNITYSIVATNNGPSAAPNAIVSENWAALPGLDCSTTTGGGTATCAASGTAGTQCPATVTPEGLQSGLLIPAFPNGGIVTFTLTCRVTATGTP